MKEIVTRCGYRCDICPVFAPNIKSPEDARAASEGFRKYYGFQIEPDKIACDGCLSNGRLVDKDCPVRPCVLEKGLENCAECSAFASCDKLKTRMDFLDPMPEKLKNIPEDEFKKFVTPYQSKARMYALWVEFIRLKGP